MQIFISNKIIILSSTARTTTPQTFALDVPDNSTIHQVKQLTQLKTQLHPSDIRLMYCGKILADDKGLANYGITKESTLTLLPCLNSTNSAHEIAIGDLEDGVGRCVRA